MCFWFRLALVLTCFVLGGIGVGGNKGSVEGTEQLIGCEIVLLLTCKAELGRGGYHSTVNAVAE